LIPSKGGIYWTFRTRWADALEAIACSAGIWVMSFRKYAYDIADVRFSFVNEDFLALAGRIFAVPYILVVVDALNSNGSAFFFWGSYTTAGSSIFVPTKEGVYRTLGTRWTDSFVTVTSCWECVWVMGFRMYTCDIAHDLPFVDNDISWNTFTGGSATVPRVDVMGKAVNVE